MTASSRIKKLILLTAAMVMTVKLPAMAAQPEPGKVTLKAYVSVRSEEKNVPEEEYTFHLEPVSDNAPMPEKKEITVKTNGEGEAVFGEAVYDREGIYMYKVSQTAKVRPGFTVDASVYTVYVTAYKEELDSPSLSMELTAKKDGSDGKSDRVSFVNMYKKIPATAKRDSIKTGDSKDLLLYESAVLGSGVVLFGIFIMAAGRRKRKK